MNAEQHTGLGNSGFSRPDAKKNRDIVNLGCSPYLIFVVNAVYGVPVIFLAECKKIPEERENYRFGPFIRQQ